MPMLRYSAASLGLAMVVGVSLLVTAPPAQAAGCVTPKEFARAKPGMSVSQVASIFGTKGKVSTRSEGFGTTIIIRSYNACTEFGAVSVLFTNGRLTTKSGVF